MEPYIEDLINELIDEFIDDGEVEFISQFCIPLPTVSYTHLTLPTICSV